MEAYKRFHAANGSVLFRFRSSRLLSHSTPFKNAEHFLGGMCARETGVVLLRYLCAGVPESLANFVNIRPELGQFYGVMTPEVFHVMMRNIRFLSRFFPA